MTVCCHAALVAAGWKTGEIRAHIKGDNARIGEEVEAERVRQGLAREAQPVTPIARRPYDPSLFYEPIDDPAHAEGPAATH